METSNETYLTGREGGRVNLFVVWSVARIKMTGGRLARAEEEED